MNWLIKQAQYGWVLPNGKWKPNRVEDTHSDTVRQNYKLFGLSEADLGSEPTWNEVLLAMNNGAVRVWYGSPELHITAKNLDSAKKAEDIIYSTIDNENAESIIFKLEDENRDLVVWAKDFKENGWDAVNVHNKVYAGVTPDAPYITWYPGSIAPNVEDELMIKRFPIGKYVDIPGWANAKVSTQPQYSNRYDAYVFWVTNQEGEQLMVKEVPKKGLEVVGSLSILAYVDKEKDGWHVYSENGKHLGGPYPSEAQANYRLQQCEYFAKQPKEKKPKKKADDQSSSYDNDGDPDGVRWQPAKPLWDANIEDSYMCTTDTPAFTGENPEENDRVRHQTMEDPLIEKKPITLFPEWTSTAELDERERGRMDQFIDLGLSSLADHNDSVSRVMDWFLSAYGGELSDEAWAEVEEELQQFVDNLEPREGSIKEASAPQELIGYAQQLKQDGLTMEECRDDMDEKFYADYGKWNVIDAVEVVYNCSIKQAQINFEVVETSERPGGYEALIRIPRSLTKATDVRSLNKYFRSFVNDFGYKLEEKLGKGITYKETDQYYPDVQDQYVDFLLQYNKPEGKEKAPTKKEPEVKKEEEMLKEAPIEKEESKAPTYQTFDYSRVAAMSTEEELTRMLKIREKGGNDFLIGYLAGAVDKKTLNDALNEAERYLGIQPRAAFSTINFPDIKSMKEAQEILEDYRIPVKARQADLQVPWFATEKAIDHIHGYDKDLVYSVVEARHKPIQADFSKFKRWVLTDKQEAISTFLSPQVKGIDIHTAASWQELSGSMPQTILVNLLEEYIDKHATLMTIQKEGAKSDLFKSMPSDPEQRKQMRYDPAHPTSKNVKKLTKRLLELGVPANEVSEVVLEHPLTDMDALFNLGEALFKLGEQTGLTDVEMFAYWK